MVKKVTENVPHGCKVEVKTGHAGQGWCMKDPTGWVREAFDEAGADFFDGNKVGQKGGGGSIPFLAELCKQYPETQIYAMGVLGPGHNAHGPNENINLAYTKKLTGALSHLIGSVGAHQ
jgi:acetylornithine deacetylase/succinyl-diaminopimelate desuccinylase-like protein